MPFYTPGTELCILCFACNLGFLSILLFNFWLLSCSSCCSSRRSPASSTAASETLSWEAPVNRAGWVDSLFSTLKKSSGARQFKMPTNFKVYTFVITPVFALGLKECLFDGLTQVSLNLLFYRPIKTRSDICWQRWLEDKLTDIQPFFLHSTYGLAYVTSSSTNEPLM